MSFYLEIMSVTASSFPWRAEIKELTQSILKSHTKLISSTLGENFNVRARGLY